MFFFSKGGSWRLISGSGDIIIRQWNICLLCVSPLSSSCWCCIVFTVKGSRIGFNIYFGRRIDCHRGGSLISRRFSLAVSLASCELLSFNGNEGSLLIFFIWISFAIIWNHVICNGVLYFTFLFENCTASSHSFISFYFIHFTHLTRM